ncbi:S1 family peptidase [Actinopolyspora mortivallis]|uniref:S1 family peptidase n=1 Tax=Actinopolyspora mortivallis TaxID=33906 RepID=UPI000525EE2A|nr:serine protease [Actinopolyspora mortivallis]
MRGRSWRDQCAVLLAALLWTALTPLGAAAGEARFGSLAAERPVVGGEPARVADHPWVVYLTDRRGEQFCGGTLAAPDKVVTAAHCVAEQRPDDVRVVAGRTDKNSGAGTVTELAGIWTHPDYSSAYRGADVAVLTLRSSLSRPTLALADGQDEQLYRPGRMATVLGWGATSEGGVPADVLRRAEVPIRADSECSAAYGGDFVPGAMVCAGYTEGGVDSCQGDSGGPLTTGGKLVGVVSWGIGCARPGNPGVYTEVAAYADSLRARLGSRG